MVITPVTEGRFQAQVRLDNGTTATSKPFDDTDKAANWGRLFAENDAAKAPEEDYSAEVKASLHSVSTE